MAKDDYLDILKDWERLRALPAVYESLDVLFPEFSFRRMQAGSARDRWVSRLKADLSEPKHPNPEKTVVGRKDMRIREQGEWNDGEGVMDRLMRDHGFKDIYEAFRYVSDVLALDMPRPDGEQVRRAASARERRERLLEYLEDYFAWCLWNANKAQATRDYLETERDFPRESWDTIGFGFVPDWGTVCKRVTSDGGFTVDELSEFCGVSAGEGGRTLVGSRNVLAIPFRSGGVLRGFLFRAIVPVKGPKYLATAGLDRKAALFNFPREGEQEVIAVVEGELDALQATAKGVPGVCAIGGSDLAGDRRSLLRHALSKGVKKIILCLDLDGRKDAPGEPDHASRHNHVMRCVHAAHEIDFSFDGIYVALLPYVCDPDEYIRKEGPQAFLEILSGALPYWEYDYLYRKGELETSVVD